MSKFFNQPALPLEFSSASSRASFVVGHSNVEAWDYLSQRATWPTNSLALFGPASSGKTHLGAIWARRSDAEFLTLSNAKDLERQESLQKIWEKPRDLVIDTEDLFSEQCTRVSTCEQLFHSLTAQEAIGGRTLILLRTLPLHSNLPDLESRLKAMTRIEIMNPDDTVLSGMLKKILEDLGAAVHVDATKTAAQLMPRSGAAAYRLAHHLNEASLATGRRVTPSLVRSVLSQPEILRTLERAS